MPIAGGRLIQKGSVPHVCKECRKITYTIYLWSEREGRYQAVIVDCLRDGALHPTKNRGGVGTAHACKQKGAA